MALYRYSQWDGTQEIPPLDPDDLLEAITDDLMNFGDLQHALRSLLQRGMRNPLGQRLQGLRDLLQQLRQQRRDTLDRYNLSSIFDDIKNRLDEILRMERDTLQRRLQEALEQGAESGQPDEGAAAQPSPSGQEAQAGAPSREFAQMLQKIAQRKQSFLDNLPEDVPGRIKELQNYEFMDPEAQHRFQELMEMLKEAMTETFFKDLHDQIAGMTPEQLERLKQMVKDLNQMLSEKMAGGEPDFQRFMQQYGDLFGPNPPQSLEELIAQMQHQVAQMENLLDSLPTDMRQQLRDLLSDKIGDPELQAELAELAANLEFMYPMRELRSQYPFHGDEDLDLSEAMRLMDRMQAMTSWSASSSTPSTAATSTPSTRTSCARSWGRRPTRPSSSSGTSWRSWRRPATSAAREAPGYSRRGAPARSARRPWPRSTPSSRRTPTAGIPCATPAQAASAPTTSRSTSSATPSTWPWTGPL